MAEVQVMEEYRKKNKSKKFRISRQFAELMNYDPLEAAKYARDCGIKTEIYWVPVEEYIAQAEAKREEAKEETKEVVEIKPEVKETKTEEVTETEEEKVEISKEDLQEALKANNIEFHHALWEKKLLELAKKNGLL